MKREKKEKVCFPLRKENNKLNGKEITERVVGGEKRIKIGKLPREKSMSIAEIPIFGHDRNINISSGIGSKLY